MDGNAFVRDNFCFVCGSENPKGMHLKFERRGGKVYGRFSLPVYYQGYKDVIHGGVISLILDEAMAYLQREEERFLTGKITVRFYDVLKVGEEVEVKAEILKERKRFKVARAEMVRVADRRKIADAEAIMFVLREG